MVKNTTDRTAKKERKASGKAVVRAAGKTARRFTALLMCLVLGINMAGCSYKVKAQNLMDGVNAAKVESKTPDGTFANSQMDFAVRLFKENVAESDGNVMISPLSVMLALAMTANGADGETKTQMEKVLAGGMSAETLNEYLKGYVEGLPSDKKYKLSVANSIWFIDNENRLKVKEDFLQKNAGYYNAQIYKAVFDSSTLKDINGWVKSNTDGMIKNIIDRIEPDTIMYLINAIAFDAEWNEKYEKNNISDGTFKAENGQKKQAKMMSSTEGKYIETSDAQGFIKDYKDGKYSFVALLPNEGIGIDDYVESLKYNELLEEVNNPESTQVHAYVPKFSCEYSVSLKKILGEMGMVSAFDSVKADFSALGESANGNIFIGDVIHKTYISVDESGTKAGAATVVEMRNGSAPLEPKIVRLDRPFVYMIMDNSTGLPIFIGAVRNV